jgi:hypothetical protein
VYPLAGLNIISTRRTHYGGYSIFLQNPQGKCNLTNTKHRLRFLKVVPSVLFVNRNQLDIYLEVELYNPAETNDVSLSVSDLEIEIFPEPSLGPQCKSDLFLEVEGHPNNPNWTSMFKDFDWVQPYNDNRLFTYYLKLPQKVDDPQRIDDYEYKYVNNKVCVTPTKYKKPILNASNEGTKRYSVHGFSKIDGSEVILPPSQLYEGELKVAALYLHVHYENVCEFIDEASTIHNFDFGVREYNRKYSLNYFSFFGVLPQRCILANSQSLLPVCTYSPDDVKKMFHEWYKLSKCDSTRTHRVIRSIKDQYGKGHIYIEAIVNYPVMRFWKAFLTFLIALMGGIAANVLVYRASHASSFWLTICVGSLIIILPCGFLIIGIYKYR